MNKKEIVFPVLDADAIEMLGTIRCNKNLGVKPALKFEPVYCPSCGRSANRLSPNTYFCIWCDNEFNEKAKKTGVEGNCVRCGNIKKITARGLCSSCYRYYLGKGEH